MSLITENQVAEARQQAKMTAHPEKIAKYTTIKNQYREQNNELFTEDYRLPEYPNENDVEYYQSLASKGEKVDDERYQVVRSRFETRLSEQGSKDNVKQSIEQVEHSLIDNKVTEKDLRQAQEVARITGQIEHIAMYQTVKRALEAQNQ